MTNSRQLSPLLARSKVADPADLLRVPVADFHAEIDRRRAVKARTDLLEWVRLTYAGLDVGWHVEDLCWHLERFAEAVEAGESPRLMVMMPPRHTKSTIASQRFPVWGMGRYQWEIILATYGQDLANDHSRDAREIARGERSRNVFPHIAPQKQEKSAFYADYRRADVDQVKAWTTGDVTNAEGFAVRGRYRAVGVGGPLTGKGAKVLIIDDPIKDRSEANSANVRESVWRWYTSTAYTRLAPGGGVLVVQTRWHEDDLAGRLLRASADGTGDKWTVVNFPAIAERDEYGPQRQLRRHAGEALHPTRYPLESLERIRAINSYDFASLYQQRPVPEGGGRIKADWLRNSYRMVPAEADRPIHSWDTAIKAGEMNDYTVCHVAQTHEQRVYLTDVLRRRMEFPELLAAVKSLAMRDNPRAVLIEDKGSGQQLIQMLKRDPSWRWSVIPVTPKVDKITRMDAVTPWLESGRVWIPDAAPWLVEWMTELLGFPVAAHDDQIDSLSQLLDYLDNKGGGLSAYRELANRLASNSPNGVALARGYAPSPWRR